MTSIDKQLETEIATRLQAATAMAHEAGQVTLEYFQQDNFQVERKSDDSPVTQADRKAEETMRAHIGRLFPHDEIVGEEFGTQQGTSGVTWILDPIDGTKSFICGVPLYTVLVGVVYQRRGVVGVIHAPGLRESVYASEGQGAWWLRGDEAPRPSRVSSCASLKDGLFVTSQVDSFDERGSYDAYLRLERSAYITRSWGDGYGHMLVATGRAVAMVDPIMNIWDAAALQAVLVQSGGTYTDWNGQPTIYNGEGIATNGHVLEEVLAITREYPAAETGRGDT